MPRRQIKQPPLPFSLTERLAMLAGQVYVVPIESRRLEVCRCVPTTPDGVLIHSAEVECAHSKPWPSQSDPTPTSNTGVKDSRHHR